MWRNIKRLLRGCLLAVFLLAALTLATVITGSGGESYISKLRIGGAQGSLLFIGGAEGSRLYIGHGSLDLLGPPTDFTAERVWDEKIDLSWTMGVGASHTGIYRKFGSYPSDRTDGVEVYLGTDVVFEDIADELIEEHDVYYRAWSYQTVGAAWSVDYAEAMVGGNWNMIFLALIALPAILTFMAFRRPNILISFAAAMAWFAGGMYVVLGEIDQLPIAQDYVWIVAWVFFIMCFVPFLAQMDTEIKREAKGKGGNNTFDRWTEFTSDKPGKDYRSGYEKHKEELRRRIGRRY